jgi:ABC-type multidrug transport system ATPase subunit
MFGLDGTRHLIRIGDLSGGQKARVVLASIALKKPHVLILDEPTNNLDLESVDALIDALTVFKGGIVLVSHDQRLISKLGCQIWVCEGAHLGSKSAVLGHFTSPTGLRVEHRGFEKYRADVIQQIVSACEKAEADAAALVLQRKKDRDARISKGRRGHIHRTHSTENVDKPEDLVVRESLRAANIKEFFDKRNAKKKKGKV